MYPSELSVVGIGTGQVTQLTLMGRALVQQANVICCDSSLETTVFALCPEKRCMVLAEHDALQMEKDSRELAALIHGGAKVVRLSADQVEHRKRLERELSILQRLGVRKRFYPSVQTLQDEAWNLGLPWLLEAQRGAFRIIPSTQVRGDRNFWRYLADDAQTMAVDVGRGRIEVFVERLLLAGADPDRPVALVAHHPTRSAICWLTTLEEVDELLPQWKPQGATILYIGTWPHAIRDTDANKSFWGSLEAAAEIWLRRQRA
jgi:siroheme synthase